MDVGEQLRAAASSATVSSFLCVFMWTSFWWRWILNWETLTIHCYWAHLDTLYWWKQDVEWFSRKRKEANRFDMRIWQCFCVWSLQYLIIDFYIYEKTDYEVVKSICIFCELDRLLFYRFLYMGWISKMGSWNLYVEIETVILWMSCILAYEETSKIPPLEHR